MNIPLDIRSAILLLCVVVAVAIVLTLFQVGRVLVELNRIRWFREEVAVPESSEQR